MVPMRERLVQLYERLRKYLRDLKCNQTGEHVE